MDLQWVEDVISGQKRATAKVYGGLITLEVRQSTRDHNKYMAQAIGQCYVYLGQGIKGEHIGMLEACAVAEYRFFQFCEKNQTKGSSRWQRFLKGERQRKTCDSKTSSGT